MHISSLSIRNYRNFKAAKFNFKKGINTIIGENGAGKTNIFQALRILLDDSLPRYLNFYESDFNRSLGKSAGHWIIISVVFDELDISEEAQAFAIHSSGHMKKNGKGSFLFYFRPEYKVRKELYDFSQKPDKTKEGLQHLLDKITLDDYKPEYLSRGLGDFSKDQVYKKYVGDFEKIEFPDPDKEDESIYGTWLPKELNIHNEVSCTFIKALRDVDRDLRSYKNNPLIQLLRGKEKTISVEKQQEIENKITNLNKEIGSLDEVNDIKYGIKKSIIEAVGTTYAPNINIKSELPDKMEKLFQSLRLWAGDPDEEGYEGELWELSLGGANLIYLSLKLLEYEKLRTDRIANFLLIEEPESHIHTHIQKTLFENLADNRTQVIVSTHSTNISSVSKISSVNVLGRNGNQSEVFEPSNSLTSSEVTKIERYLDAVRSDLLFAKGVILVEGDVEQILIPEMFKSVFGISLDEIGVSIVNIGSTGFKNIARLFHPDRIRKKCAIITDLDTSVITLPKDCKDDNKAEKKARNSQKSGQERKIKLDELCKGNVYLAPFYANYTFEVDFIKNGNSHEIIQCLDEIYDSSAAKNKSEQKLKKESAEVSGVEILRLANKMGKGWFALIIAEHFVYNTYIPNYILEAIAFAASHIKTTSKVKAIYHRVSEISTDKDDEYFKTARDFKLEGSTDEEIVKKFRDSFKNDQLSKLLKLI